MNMRALCLVLAGCLPLGACGDDTTQPTLTGTDAADTTTGDASGDVAASDTADDTTTEDAADDAGDDTVTPDAGDDVEADTMTDSGDDAAAPDTSTGDDVLVDCHDLSYEITCDDPSLRTGGYYACSDYFGDTTGVEVQCSANPAVDVRDGGPPCGEYTHYVGSCVYYSDALPDRCYVTHVGAENADLVEAGRTFWRTACAGEWIE